MKRIIVETSDGVIWHRERTMAELTTAALAGPVLVDLNEEGPCCEDCGIDDLLDLIVEKFNVNPEHFIIKTSNQITSSHYQEQRHSFGILDYVLEKAQSTNIKNSSLDKKFGLFIGRSNWNRLALASYLNQNYSDVTAMTYHYDLNEDFCQENFGLESFYKRFPDELDQVCQLIKKLPLKDAVEYTYPIQWSAGALDLDKYYGQIFCDIVCETYFSGNTFFITEKTWRPMMFKRPFLVQSSKNYLKNLKKPGFKTFDRWWDEGYDEDPADFKYQALKQNIDYIGQQPIEVIRRWNEEMQEVLEHNYQRLFTLTCEEILETNFDE